MCQVALHDRVGSVAMSSAGGTLLCSIAPTANAYVIMEAKNITVAPELSFQVKLGFLQSLLGVSLGLNYGKSW